MRAVTVNVSAASPFGDTRRRVAGMTSWARDALTSDAPPALVFAQECHPDWLEVWRQAGYRVLLGDSAGQPGYKVQSALIAAPGINLKQATLEDAPSLAYHGSYVAAATWDAGLAEPVLVLSVHASPSRAEQHMSTWPDAISRPEPRRMSGDGPSRAELWDADSLLATLRHHAARGDLLAAGDFNEALGWDDAHPGDTSGADYFVAVAEAGLVSVLHARWGRERATRRVGEEGLQLDHVVTTAAIANWITGPEIDERWTSAGQHDDWSDHAPVWFTLTLPPTP